MPQDEGIRTVSGQTGMNHTLFQEEAEPLRQAVQEGGFAAAGAGEGEPARQEAGMGEFAEQLEPSRDLSLYVKDAREIDGLMAGAGFDAVLDRDSGKISAIRFEMLQKQPFEEVLRATPGERREAGRAFLRRLKANQISPEAFRPQGEAAAEQARDSARMYGAFFRTAGERLRAYALPEGDLKDPGFLASRAGELYALRESLKDYAGSQRLLRELPGFEEGFLEQGGLDLEQFEAPMDVMRCFAGAALQSLDPEGLGERRGLGESLAQQVAGRLFLDAYGELLAGRSAADLCDGFGNRELACLLNFTGTAEYMTGRLLEQDPEGRERCLAYLQGGEPPLSAASVEEELGYRDKALHTAGMARQVEERRRAGEGMGQIDRSRLAQALSGTWHPEGWGRFAGKALGDVRDLQGAVPRETSLPPEELGPGPEAFDRMFARLAREDRGLGNGDFSRAHPLYGRLGASCAAELFFVDGKPVEEYARDRCGALEGKAREDALKREVMKSILDGKHHVEFARLQSDAAGTVQVGVGSVKAQPPSRERGGLFRRRAHGQAWSRQTDPDRGRREEEIRSRFGERVEALLAQQKTLSQQELFRQEREHLQMEQPQETYSQRPPQGEAAGRKTQEPGAADRQSARIKTSFAQQMAAQNGPLGREFPARESPGREPIKRDSVKTARTGPSRRHS